MPLDINPDFGRSFCYRMAHRPFIPLSTQAIGAAGRSFKDNITCLPEPANDKSDSMMKLGKLSSSKLRRIRGDCGIRMWKEAGGVLCPPGGPAGSLRRSHKTTLRRENPSAVSALFLDRGVELDDRTYRRRLFGGCRRRRQGAGWSCVAVDCRVLLSPWQI
jgi:hypothetical protein